MNCSICDLQYGHIITVPNSIFEYLRQSRNIAISELVHFDPHNCDLIREYIRLLETDGWGFTCSDPSFFPELNLSWESYSEITNCIIDIGIESNHDYNKIFGELEQLGCAAVQLRAYRPIVKSELEQILAPTHESRLTSIELIIPFTPLLSESDVIQLCQINRRIKAVILHGAPFEKSLSENLNGLTSIHYTSISYNSNNHCGMISPLFFSSNVSTFSEAQQYNSCLNRKVGIDTNGDIKNCPSMMETFGNISETSLLSVIRSEDFKKHWSITKDQISVCKDCEFRYVCTDCRAYVEEPADVLSKPLKCGYDPYTATWHEWSNNPLQQKASAYYKMSSLSPRE